MRDFGALLQAWNIWWYRQCPPHALAIVRICVGLFLLTYAGTYILNIPLLFSNEGMALPLLADVNTPLPTWIIQPPSVAIAYLIACIFLIAIILFTIGWYYRLATIILIILGIYYWQLSLHLFATSYNRLILFALIILLFSGADRTYSLRMKKEKGAWDSWFPISILPSRLLAVQVTVTYLGVGLQKYTIEGWQGGEILYYSMMGMWSTSFARWLMQSDPPMALFDFLVLVTILFETVMPFGLWHAKTRKWWMLGGIGFHFFIAIFLSIWWFIALYPLYLLFFVPEDVYDWVKERLQGRQKLQ